MQINKQELDMQLIALLPERETLFFNRNWQANFANVEVWQNAQAQANAGHEGFLNIGNNEAAAIASNSNTVDVNQSNDN